MRISACIFFLLLLFAACNERRPVKLFPRFGKPAAAAMQDFQFTPANAHPTARRLMQEDFFWSDSAAAAPFGNEAGADAAHLYREWRRRNPSDKTVAFLRGLINSRDMPYFDWNELDTTQVREYISGAVSYDTAPDVQAAYLLWQDQTIIGTVFAQFALEGKADEDVRQIAGKAISRQLLPLVLAFFPPEERAPRREAYGKLLVMVRQMNAG